MHWSHLFSSFLSSSHSLSVSLFLSRSTAESNCPIHKPNPTYLSAIDSLSCSLRGVILSRCPESGGGGVFGAVRGAPVVFGSGIVFMSLRVFCFHACSIFLLGSRVFFFAGLEVVLFPATVVVVPFRFV
jgi:hypothetical protein